MRISLSDNELKYLKLVIGQELFWENLAVANGVDLRVLHGKLGGAMKKPAIKNMGKVKGGEYGRKSCR